MYIFSKIFRKASENNLTLLVILMLSFLSILNISFTHVEGALANDITRAKTVERAECAGAGCPPYCLPISLGLSVDVMEAVGPEVATFCIQLRAKGYKHGSGWFRSFVYASGYPSQSMCTCGIPHGQPPYSGCYECSGMNTKTLTAPGGIIYFSTTTNMYYANGMVYCRCTTDPIPVLIEPPDTSEELPTPEELGPPPCEAQAGDPINVTNGNMYLEERDVFIQTGKGLPFYFSRSYNSFGDSSTSFPLGYNWKHNFQYSIEIDTATGNVTLNEPTGREITFVYFEWENTIEYTPPYGIHYRLEHDTLTDLYTLIKPDDTKYYFDSTHSLAYIEDRNANQIMLNYSGGILQSIADAAGREIHLTYQDSKIHQVQNGSGEVLATYEYYPNDNLKKVTYADSSWVMYTYGEKGRRGAQSNPNIKFRWRYSLF